LAAERDRARPSRASRRKLARHFEGRGARSVAHEIEECERHIAAGGIALGAFAALIGSEARTIGDLVVRSFSA